MTRELIERYDDKAQANPPNRAPLNHIQPTSAMSTPNSQTLRQRIPPGSSPSTMVSAPTNQSNYASPAVQPPRSAHQFGPGNSSSSSAPSPLSARGWADRVANVLLGDDEARPESKYALICKKCFSHNGLVLKEELDHIQYRCPHCGNFNPAKNLNRENETSSLPTNSTSEGEDENDKMTSLIQQKNKKYQRQSLGLPQSTGPLQSTVESNRRAISLNSSESSRSLNKDLVDQSKSLEEDSMSSGSTEQ
ncbi:hypothetical protein BY996DRAFT_6846043 [Phakopsora pachyrhizi]|nr:hypothetical protein BY996DRAFT_6846043 [Phakopsora pachyrhizi]